MSKKWTEIRVSLDIPNESGEMMHLMDVRALRHIDGEVAIDPDDIAEAELRGLTSKVIK